VIIAAKLLMLRVQSEALCPRSQICAAQHASNLKLLALLVSSCQWSCWWRKPNSCFGWCFLSCKWNMNTGLVAVPGSALKSGIF